ncbi:MAG: transposon-encoded TnpW family protein [Eubacterium sp.]|nr:transposon-encoded TnpW family protein [Eubacterium sp.]
MIVARGQQIGGTTYVVRVHFNEDAKETMKDKIKSMLENDVKMSQNTT